MTYTEKIERFKEIIKDSQNVVFFGGAGVSTESGIPDFRSQDGLYHQKYSLPPEEIISASYFYADTDGFYGFYKEKMLFPTAEPNACHKALAKLEKQGKLTAVVTQNIDGLHQKAGSQTVYELHGSVWRNFCTKCKKFYSLYDVVKGAGTPVCSCGGVIKPDVVLYEESLDDQTVRNAVVAIANADTLIIGGTSLVVQPAASLLRYFQGRHLIVVNKTPTFADEKAELVIAEKIGKVFSDLMEE